MSEWNDSLAGDYLWSNVNFGEAVTDVMTPLTWSVIQFTLEDWVFLPGMPTVGVIGGRPYINISIFATLFFGMGRSRQHLLRNLESTLYMRLPDDMPIPSIPISRTTLLRGMFCSLQVQRKQRGAVRQAPRYVQTNSSWFQRIRKEIQSQSTKLGLYDLWQTGMRAHIKRGVWCVLGSAAHSSEFTLKLRHQLTELAGADDASVLIANVGEGDAPLESLGPLLGLQKLVLGDISRTAYLDSHGHRGPQEFELSVPRPAEDPSWLEQELTQARQSPMDVDEQLARQRQSFQNAWRRLQARSSRTGIRFSSQIAESARRTRLRELSRSAYVRDRWAIRLFALRAGELTGLGAEVFHLTLGELLALLSGDHSVTRVIEPRAAAYRQFKTLPPYPAVIRGPFDPFAWAADPDRPTDIYDAHRVVSRRTDAGLLEGSPGSAGVVEGVVRIIDHPQQGHTLQQGEIMVAVQTDVAWTLFFPRAAAIVTDIGAPLSHAAIVARELGIPAVVGCGSATARLRTGDRVRVDGRRGTVEILHQA